MSTLVGRNALVNLVGSLAGPLIGFVMTPFYLRKVGLEGLGLIGLMTLVTTVLGIFIAGASKTYQRDLSTAQLGNPEDLAGIAKGGIGLFALLGAAMGLGILLLGRGQIQELAVGTNFAGPIAYHCLIIISIMLFFNVLTGAFGATLAALRDQTWPNAASIFIGTLTAAVTWIFLSKFPRVDVFYLCQFGNGLLTCGFLFWRTSKVLKLNLNNSVSRSMRDVWRGRLGRSGRLSLVLIVHEGLGVVIAQIDRLLVTSHFPISALGSYNLGANPSRLVGIFTGPINTVTYPEFCRIAGDDSEKSRVGEYLGRITFILFLLFCAAMVILIPSGDAMMELWLGKHNVPAQAANCFILLSAGNLLLAIAAPAYHVTVAFGKVGYGIIKNIISVIVLPLIGMAALKRWGITGIATLPALYSVSGIIVCSWFAYRRHGSFKASNKWFGADLICLVATAALVAALKMSGLSGLLVILGSTICSAVMTLIMLRIYFGGGIKAWLQAFEIGLVKNYNAPVAGDNSLIHER